MKLIKNRNLAGLTIGKLTILEFVGLDEFGHPSWRYQCECGRTGTYPDVKLRNNKITSCGKCEQENKDD